MKKLITLAVFVCTSFVTLAQNESSIPKISQQLTDYFSFYPKDKIFISTDKKCYKPGETIWFNVMVTDTKTQLPAPDVQEITIKLCNRKGEQVAGDNYQVQNGSTPGDMDIPGNLPGDSYFLIAYCSSRITTEEIFCTTLNIDPAYSNQLIVSSAVRDSISVGGQKNELTIQLKDLSGDIQKNTLLRFQFMNGKEILEKGKIKTDDTGKAVLPFTLPEKTTGDPFICELVNAKDDWRKELYLPSNLDPIEINFYPEGGSITAGVPVKIGFTAFNKWGLPVDIEGTLIDQDSKQVAVIKTFTAGLGLFAVVNDGKQKIKLVLSGKTGQNQSFELPAPNPTGLAFSVTKIDPEFISVNLVFADKQKHNIAITVTNGSSLYWAADTNIDGIGRIKIPVENLPQGVNQLSVFTNEGKIIANRLVFIDKKQQLKVEVVPDKNSLKQGENMKVKIKLTDENNQPVSGNVSVSVADNFWKTEKALSIDKYLLTDADLATPFSLISDSFKDQISNTATMDVFMLANRQKGFNWQKIIQFKPENSKENNSYSYISGFVTDKNGNKINKAKVSLVNNKNMQSYSSSTDENGLFKFPNLNLSEKDDFSVKATDDEGKYELNVIFSKNFDGQIGDYIWKEGQKRQLSCNDLTFKSSYMKNNPDLFIKAPKVERESASSSENQQRMLGTATNILDVIKTIKPYKIMNNQIVFVGTENSLFFQGGALLVLDGQQLGTDISILQSISPMDVDHINVSTNAMDIHKYTALNSVGVVEIYLKRAKAPIPKATKESNIVYNGIYRTPRLFSSDGTDPKRDFRTTLLWIPELKVDDSGIAEITLTAGKVLTDFIIEVQGISTNGTPGIGSGRFSVQK